jgi:hypothetical protein
MIKDKEHFLDDEAREHFLTMKHEVESIFLMMKQESIS